MPITINGSGTITGLSAGGLPDGTVQPADLSTGAPTWDSSGNVGIGTSSPATKLEATGTIRSSSGSGQLNVGITGGIPYIQGFDSVTSSNSQIAFYTNTERMRIDTSGNVGIGTSSPSARLDLGTIANGTTFVSATNGVDSNFILSFNSNVTRINNGGGSGSIAFGTGGSIERARFDASGNFLIGKTALSNTAIGFEYALNGTNPYTILTGSSSGVIGAYHVYSTGAGAYRFYVTYSGQIYATSTSIVAISDASLKENIRDLDTGLAQVMALRPRRFDWKAEAQIEDKNVAGFIAQEVEEVLPELVYEYKYTENETKKSLKMGDILPTLVKAIQELNAKVDAQAAEIAALKGAA